MFIILIVDVVKKKWFLEEKNSKIDPFFFKIEMLPPG